MCTLSLDERPMPSITLLDASCLSTENTPMIPKRLLKRLSVRQLREAIRIKSGMQRVEKLERQRDQLLRQAKKLDRKIARLSGGNGSVAVPTKRRRRKMSAETRRKMAVAARKRWAKVKGGESK